MDVLIGLALGLALGAVGGVFGARKYWPRFEPVPQFLIDSLPPAIKRFRVVFSTDSGAGARQLFEKVRPSADGVVEFWDGKARRSIKQGE